MSKEKLSYKEFKWNEKIAYVIGLLTTDGNLSKDGHHIVFKSSDLQLVRVFKKCLNLSNKIAKTKKSGWEKKPHYRIQFGNVQFYKWLLRIGLCPRKTKKLKEIKIPNKYFKDFLRGHLDGDGSICSYRDYWNTFKNPKYIYERLWIRFLSTSKNHVLWLHRKIKQFLNVRGHIWERKPRRNDQTTSVWELKFGKKDSLKILKWIYYKRELPCLERKRKIAEKFLTKIIREGSNPSPGIS